MSTVKIVILLASMIGLASVADANSLIIPAPGTEVIYDTFGPNDSYSSGGGWVVSGFFPGIQSGEVIAAAFTPNADATFADAWLPLTFEGSGAGSSINVYLESDSGGLPSVILATLTLNFGQLTGTSSILGFECDKKKDCRLTKGTQYWLVAQQTAAATSDLWNLANSTSGGPFAFNLLDSATGPWLPTSSTTIFDGSPAFAVDVVVTPEPGTVVLFGSGLISILGLTRRKLFTK